jgi:type I restriction enzyme S subunit
MMPDQAALKLARIRDIPDGWRLGKVGKDCSIRNELRLPISQDDRRKMSGDYPYYGPTGVLDYIDEYRLDGTFALIGEDGDHFLKFNDRPMTQLIHGKSNVNNHAHIIEGTADCSAEWFYHYFKHRDITHVLSRQGAGRYKLNKATLEGLPILLPPLPLQGYV